MNGENNKFNDEARVLDFLDLSHALSNIFTRLPVADLVRLGCVTKSLNKIVKDCIPKRLRKMILIPSIPFHSLCLADYSWIPNKIPVGRVSEVFPHYEFPHYLIVGSVEGTVLIVELTARPQNMILVNPLTCHHTLIIPPRHDLLLDDNLNTKSYSFGLGWAGNPSEVIIVVMSNEFGIGYNPICEMFTCKKKSWKTLVPVRELLTIKQLAGTFHKETESLYWIAEHDCHVVSPVILKFNIAEEVFTFDMFDREVYGHPVDTLGIVDGKLCALTYFYDSHCYEVRALDENRWSKLHFIEGNVIHNRQQLFMGTLLTFTEDGQLFFLNSELQPRFREFLMVYRIWDSSIQEIQIPSTVRGISSLHAAVYVENTNLSFWTPDHADDKAGEQNMAVDGVCGENFKDLEIKAGDEE